MVNDATINTLEKWFNSSDELDHKKFKAHMMMSSKRDKEFIIYRLESLGNKIRGSWYSASCGAESHEDTINTLLAYFEATDRVSHRYFTMAFRDASDALREKIIERIISAGHVIERSWFALSIKRNGFKLGKSATTITGGNRRKEVGNRQFYLSKDVHDSVCHMAGVIGVNVDALVNESVAAYMVALMNDGVLKVRNVTTK